MHREDNERTEVSASTLASTRRGKKTKNRGREAFLASMGRPPSLHSTPRGNYVRGDLVVKGREDLGAIGNKGKSIFSIDELGQMTYPKALKPVINKGEDEDAKVHSSHGKDEQTSDLNARTKPEVHRFLHAQRKKRLEQPPLVIERKGMRLASDMSTGVSARKQENNHGGEARAVEKIEHVLYSQYHDVLRLFRNQDDGSELLPRDKFLSVLHEIRMGLNPADIRWVILEMDHCGHMEGDKISYSGFLDRFGGEKALRASQERQLKQRAPKLKTPLDDKIRFENQYGKPRKIGSRKGVDSDMGPDLVFWLGCLCCPVWCFGWAWICSENRRSRRRAWCSILMSLVSIVVGVTVVAVMFSKADMEKAEEIEPMHCEPNQGILMAVRLSGISASFAQLRGYAEQFRFKQAIYYLWYPHLSVKGWTAEQLIMIDSISDLLNDPDGASVMIVLRMRTHSPFETDSYTKLLLGWVKDDSLLKSLQTNQLLFTAIYPGVIKPPMAPDVEITTPRSYSISPHTQVFFNPNSTSFNYSSLPYLGQQPPYTSSSAPSINPAGWKHHNSSSLQTCWWTGLIPSSKLIVPNDICLDQFGVSCESTGAAETSTGGQRFVQVNVKTESIYDIFDVFVRQDLAGVDSMDIFDTTKRPPRPNWFVSSDIKIRGQRDIMRCMVRNDEDTCKFNYAIRLNKGPHKFQYQVGIVGQNWRAANVPFKVQVEYGNFNSQYDAYNPFVYMGAAPERRAYDESFAFLACLFISCLSAHVR